MTLKQLNDLNKKLGWLQEEYEIANLINDHDWVALEMRRLTDLAYERGLTNGTCLKICSELRRMLENHLHDENLKRVYLNKIESYYDFFLFESNFQY